MVKLKLSGSKVPVNVCIGWKFPFYLEIIIPVLDENVKKNILD